MRFIVALVLAFLALFTGTALAAQAAAPDQQSLLDLAKPVFDAVMHGQWWAAASLALVLAMALTRKYMPSSWKTGTKGDIVGVVTTFGMAFFGAIATTLAGPGAAAMSFAVALTALKIGVAAIGGYSILHKLAAWLVASGELPAWAVPVVKLVTAMIGSNAAATLKKAEDAGDAAVKAEPPKGMAGDDKIIEVE